MVQVGRKQAFPIRGYENPQLSQRSYTPPPSRNVKVFPDTNYAEAREQAYEARELVGQARRANRFIADNSMFAGSYVYGRNMVGRREKDETQVIMEELMRAQRKKFNLDFEPRVYEGGIGWNQNQNRGQRARVAPPVFHYVPPPPPNIIPPDDRIFDNADTFVPTRSRTAQPPPPPTPAATVPPVPQRPAAAAAPNIVEQMRANNDAATMMDIQSTRASKRGANDDEDGVPRAKRANNTTIPGEDEEELQRQEQLRREQQILEENLAELERATAMAMQDAEPTNPPNVSRPQTYGSNVAQEMFANNTAGPPEANPAPSPAATAAAESRKRKTHPTSPDAGAGARIGKSAVKSDTIRYNKRKEAIINHPGNDVAKNIAGTNLLNELKEQLAQESARGDEHSRTTKKQIKDITAYLMQLIAPKNAAKRRR